MRKAGLPAQRPLSSSLSRLGIRRKLCMRLYHTWCQSLTAHDDLLCQPPPTLRRAARRTLKSASVVATQGSAVALPPPRGGRSPSGTPRSDILRNSTAIQRVLPMAARRAHKSECGERRRGASRDGGLRRGVARGTCRSQRQQPPCQVSRPRAGGTARSAPRWASREISRRGKRSLRRHGPQIVLWRSEAPLARPEPLPAQPTRALHAGVRDV